MENTYLNESAARNHVALYREALEPLGWLDDFLLSKQRLEEFDKISRIYVDGAILYDKLEKIGDSEWMKVKGNATRGDFRKTFNELAIYSISSLFRITAHDSDYWYSIYRYILEAVYTMPFRMREEDRRWYTAQDFERMRFGIKLLEYHYDRLTKRDAAMDEFLKEFDEIVALDRDDNPLPHTPLNDYHLRKLIDASK